MKRLAPVLILAIVLALAAGTAVGYYVLADNDSKGTSAECLILKRDLEKLTYRGEGRGDSRSQSVVDRYNEECR